MEDLILPDTLRPYLRKPLGELFTEEGAMERIKKRVRDSKVITVGDVVSSEAEKIGIKPKLKIIDFRTKRKNIDSHEPSGRVIRAKNPPAHITKELWDAVREAVNSDDEVTIIVEGEEDLAVLPAVIEADWGDYVIYGQPEQGVVLVSCSDDSKLHVGIIIKMIMDRKELKI
ncbi:hypothetical protein IPdc08_01792 [archaeon]|nr:hypothetical protein IPdc08_01792 [archaeon]